MQGMVCQKRHGTFFVQVQPVSKNVIIAMGTTCYTGCNSCAVPPSIVPLMLDNAVSSMA